VRTLPWADLVFHVLAHVRAGAELAPSLYDPAYTAWAERALGPASGRALAEDLRALGALLATHEAQATAQLVACLFDTAEEAGAHADRALAELSSAEVRAPEVLAPLSALGAGAELLWCAALLEAPAHARLPMPAVDARALADALARAAEVAPELARCEVAHVRALRIRGRVLGSAIWVGVPCEELALTAEHVAWQAAHEATVREVSLERALAHDALEEAALARLAERARALGRGAEHARWRACFR